MSYWCYMQIDTGGEHPATVCKIGNMTSNVSPMWTTALGGRRLSELGGDTGALLIPVLERALAHINAPENREAYAAMNPKNGWGSHGGAAEYLAKILTACREHPKAVFHASY